MSYPDFAQLEAFSDPRASLFEEQRQRGERGGGPLVAPAPGSRETSTPDPGNFRRAPRYVRGCAESPAGHWTAVNPATGEVHDARLPPMILRTWKRGTDPADGSRRAARCGSWRCPSCAWWRNAQDFARIVEAFDALAVEECCFMVLTMERRLPTALAYQELSRLSRNFLSRLRRAFGGEPGNRWVMVVEQHRDGYPHANLLMHAPAIAANVSASVKLRRKRGLNEAAIHMRGELERHARGAGWGHCTAEPIRVQQRDAEDPAIGMVAAYLIKVAARETAKLAQLPTEAPKGFRRLRSGQRFLPPPRKDPTMTGALLARDDAGRVRVVGGREMDAELERAVASEGAIRLLRS